MSEETIFNILDCEIEIDFEQIIESSKNPDKTRDNIINILDQESFRNGIADLIKLRVLGVIYDLPSAFKR
jgi:hypothetical protein